VENSQNFQQILTGSLNVEKFKLIHIFSLYKAQVQVDKGPPHKTSYTESNRRENGKEPWTHWRRGNFPEPNTNGSGSKIYNQQMGTHKTEKLL